MSDVQQAKDALASGLVSVRNILTHCAVSVLTVKDLLTIETLFDWGSCQAQGSSAEMMQDAVIIDSFLLWAFLTMLF